MSTEYEIVISVSKTDTDSGWPNVSLSETITRADRDGVQDAATTAISRLMDDVTEKFARRKALKE